MAREANAQPQLPYSRAIPRSRSSASAADISRDIAGVAKEVHIASRSALDGTTKRHPSYDNIWLHSMVKLLGYSPMIERVHEDDSVAFQDVSVIFADVIFHCTGYKYHFPFLDTNGLVTMDDNRVGPLYKHIFLPALAPRLSFVGLPWKVVPFAMFEYQSKWIAGALSGRLGLPLVEEMMDNISSFTPSSKFLAYLSAILITWEILSLSMMIGLLFNLGVQSMKNEGNKCILQLPRTKS